MGPLMDNLAKGTVPLVVSTRGSRTELVYRGIVAVVSEKGKLVSSCGISSTSCYLRSVAKPFQALPLIESGAASMFGLTEAELAVAAGSHNGEPEHLGLVYSLLEKGDFSVAALQCGRDYPLHALARERVRRAGKPPGPIFHNCSGTHAGMLLASRALKARPERYRDPKHPLQKRIRATLANLTKVLPKHIPHAIDGCGIPTFALPIASIAWLFAQLVTAAKGSSLAVIASAMTRHPFAVGGTGHIDTVLMRARPGLIVKGGAAGIHAAGIPSLGLGLAVKMESGICPAGSHDYLSHCTPWREADIIHSVIIEVLRQLRVFPRVVPPSLKRFCPEGVTNSRGETVGRLIPLFKCSR